MKKEISSIIILIMLISFTSAFFIEEPMEISLKSHTCLGGRSYCLVGEEISLNLKFNQGAKLKQSEVRTKLTSNIPGFGDENILINSTGSDMDIPLSLPLSINEGRYSLSLDTTLATYSGLINNLLLRIKHLFVSKSNEEIEIRYPKLIIEETGYDCRRGKGEYYFETITLTYKDSLPPEISCKIRVYVDEDTKTQHSSFKWNEFKGNLDFYETEYKSLNIENGLTKQKILFKTAEDTQITNTYLIAVCDVEGNEVEIPNSKEDFGDCKVK